MKNEDVKLNMKVVPIYKDSRNTRSPYLYVIGKGFDCEGNCDKWRLHESSSETWRGDWYHAKDFEPYIDVEDELHQEKEEKVIVVQWNVNDSYRNGGFLSVIKSDYPSMFTVGGTYSLEIMTIALNEGYTVIVKPIEDKGE